MQKASEAKDAWRRVDVVSFSSLLHVQSRAASLIIHQRP